jgi:hypothetical protein
MEKMNRTQIYFTEKEHNKIKKESKEKGISMSDVIRRIVDKHFEEKLFPAKENPCPTH